MELIITLIIALLILFIVIVVYYFESQKPSFNCNHKMNTIKMRESSITIEYLSTCSICGKQTTHKFSGFN